jgi:hypothetical protein
MAPVRSRILSSYKELTRKLISASICLKKEILLLYLHSMEEVSNLETTPSFPTIAGTGGIEFRYLVEDGGLMNSR